MAHSTRTVAAVAMGAAALAICFTPSAARADDTAAVDACKALERTDFSGIQDAPAQVMEAAFVAAAGKVPEHCHVQGYVAPQVGFELRLPRNGWNGKFIEIGCGGSCGSTRFAGLIAWCNDALSRGYSCILSDRGHTSSRAGGGVVGADYLWAYNNLQSEFDSGIRAAHVTAVAGKAITRHYYGAAPKYSYFFGCSGGGRQGMVEAQRFPWDFDGIVAMDPSADYSNIAMALQWRHRAVTDEQGKPLFTAADLDMLHNAVAAQCDAHDGLRDGIIGDPRACSFDPAQLRCTSEKSSSCLSQKQVQAVRNIYSGPVTSSGEKLSFGAMPGSETGRSFLGLDDVWARYFRYQGFMPDPGPGWQGFDFDKDYKRLGLMGAINDATNPDLRRFQATGGKLMMIQGWDDSGSPMPLKTIDYYETMARTMGGWDATQKFARLYMMPGKAHCIGGKGANAVDYLGYLEAWVEHGRAPEMMIAAHVESQDAGDYVKPLKDLGKVEFTRPLYPYPLQSRYKGSGNPQDYRSFKPVERVR